MKTKWLIAPGLVILFVSVVAGMSAQNQPVADVGSALSAESNQQRVATLTNVAVRSGDQGISVEITCSRPIKPRLSTIADPNRLVLDFPDTISANRSNRISVGQDGLKAVRIGVQRENPPATRVVLDLEQARDYRLVATGNKLTVKLGEASATPYSSSGEETKPSAEDAKKPAEPGPNADAPSPAQEQATAPAAQDSAAPSPAPTQTETAPASTSPQPSAGLAAPKDGLPQAAAEPASNDAAGQPEAKAEQAGAQKASAPAEGDPAIANTSLPAATPGADKPQENAPGNSSESGSPKDSKNSPPQFDVKSASVSPASAATPAPKAADDKPAAPAVTATNIDPQPSPESLPDVNATGKKAEPQMAQPGPDEYTIGEQDVLTIIVWRERELSGTFVVRPDGKITLPLINEIKVVGMTPTQLQAVLTEKFKPYLTIPQVTVEVNQINSRKVYLIGEVGRTGTFPLNSSTTILQIIAEAGGLKDFAKRKAIYVLRNEHGKQVRYPFNYDDVIRGKNTQQNIGLQPGDLIVVP